MIMIKKLLLSILLLIVFSVPYDIGAYEYVATAIIEKIISGGIISGGQIR
jgi:hypothetical protein